MRCPARRARALPPPPATPVPRPPARRAGYVTPPAPGDRPARLAHPATGRRIRWRRVPSAPACRRDPILYCPNCGRGCAPSDLWCPRCGANFVAPGALQPQPEPPGCAAAAHAPGRAGSSAASWAGKRRQPAMSQRRSRSAPPVSATARPCALCGSAPRPGASFCANCGSRLTARAGRGAGRGQPLAGRALQHPAAAGAGRQRGGLPGRRSAAWGGTAWSRKR